MNHLTYLTLLWICLVTHLANAQAPIQPNQYAFETPEQALRELTYPTPTPSPTNAEIFARSEAIDQAVESMRSKNNRILMHQGGYDFYTTLFSGLKRFGIGLSDDVIARYGLDLPDDPAREVQNNSENPTPSALPFLAWRITVPDTVRSGDPIRMEVSLKNIADHDVVSGTAKVPPAFCLSSIKLVKLDDEPTPVVMTKKGIRMFYSGWFGRGVKYYKVVVKANDELKLDLVENFKITDYYDVSEPGEYELTFYTRRFIDENGNPAEDQELEYPRKATVRFTILPKGEDEE